ncbi:hypothetical protein [Aquimarina macrocephali]|uniref:hypothetical protein n=1 Tax=Aquimarina macrocephali TaxID=666563 RepID=UPI003F67B2DF
MATPPRASCLDHALHNFNACNKVKEIEKCDDWTITIAFYSSLKFVEELLFPADYPHPCNEVNITEFENFHRYVSAHGRIGRPNPHKILSELVENYIEDDDVVNYYEDLKTACYNARYINYNVGEQRKQMSLEALEYIKNFVVSK